MKRLGILVVACISLGLAACSSSSSSSSSNTDTRTQFLGTWNYKSGSTFTLTCGSNPAVVEDLSTANSGKPDSITVVTTGAANGIQMTDNLGCVFTLTANGDASTFDAGQTCDKVPNGQGGTTKLTLNSGGITSSNGELKLNVAGTIPGCNVALAGTLAKQ